jgi:single-strand DNA-binding protein
MLRVSLLGNLGGDPEARYSQRGALVISFRVAVNFVRNGPDGERQENTEWFRVRVMGRQAEFAQRLQKGNRVLVIGRLDISHYQSREGDTRVGFDVWADEVQNVSAARAAVDAEPLEADGAAESGLAGVSSLAGSGERRAAASQNGSASGSGGGRGRAASPAVPQDPAEDLEDLPF